MCCHNYNACQNTCSFCDFLRDLFTPVNVCQNGYGTSYGTGCAQTWNRCRQSCCGGVRRCSCCGQVVSVGSNETGVSSSCGGNVATYENGGGYGCGYYRRSHCRYGY